MRTKAHKPIFISDNIVATREKSFWTGFLIFPPVFFSCSKEIIGKLNSFVTTFDTLILEWHLPA